jgi:hypothetical protein
VLGNYQFYTCNKKTAINMPSFMLEWEEEKRIDTEKERQDMDNLVGFFDLLLKIDRRNNPELYKNQQSYD